MKRNIIINNKNDTQENLHGFVINYIMKVHAKSNRLVKVREHYRELTTKCDVKIQVRQNFLPASYFQENNIRLS